MAVCRACILSVLKLLFFAIPWDWAKMFDDKWFKEIKKFTTHNRYNPKHILLAYDVGIIELKQPFESEWLRPPCLPSPTDIEIVPDYKEVLMVSIQSL